MSRAGICVMACAVTVWPLAAMGQGYISQSTMTTAASDGTGNQTATDNALGFNWQHTRQVVHGVSSSTTIYDFATADGDVTFHISADHTRGGSAANAARTYGFFTFTPFEDVFYSISGDYQSTGGGTTGLEVKLESYTENLFHNIQRSTSADDHAFLVGHTGGTEQNVLTGNLTGMLAAYQSYMLTYWLELEETGGYSSAYGQGDVYLDLSPVPEPATVGMLLGGAMICALRRRLL